MDGMDAKTARRCKDCKYSETINGYVEGSSKRVVCMYIMSGQGRRNCPVNTCDKFEPKTEKRRKKA